MGQMTYAVIFGVRMESPEHLGDERWWTLSERYEVRHAIPSRRAHGAPEADPIEAVGAIPVRVVGHGALRSRAPLAGFPLDDPGSASKEHAKAIETAWTQPAIVFPVPRLYLVETEVA